MKSRGPSFEEAAWSIRGIGARAPKNVAPFAIHVDEQFTRENQKKLKALKKLNEKTDFDKVDLSKIDATLKKAKKYAPWFKNLWKFYDDLSEIKKDIFLYFPYFIQQDDGTYLIDDETSGLNAFLDVMDKVEYLFQIFFGRKKLVLERYFGTNGWKVKDINADFQNYRQEEERRNRRIEQEEERPAKAKKKNRRIEPTPRSRSPQKSPTKRRRSSPGVPARRVRSRSR